MKTISPKSKHQLDQASRRLAQIFDESKTCAEAIEKVRDENLHKTHYDAIICQYVFNRIVEKEVEDDQGIEDLKVELAKTFSWNNSRSHLVSLIKQVFAEDKLRTRTQEWIRAIAYHDIDTIRDFLLGTGISWLSQQGEKEHDPDHAKTLAMIWRRCWEVVDNPDTPLSVRTLQSMANMFDKIQPYVEIDAEVVRLVDQAINQQMTGSATIYGQKTIERIYEFRNLIRKLGLERFHLNVEQTEQTRSPKPKM